MSVQLLKPAGLSVITSQTDRPSKKKRRIPWYVYFLGSSIYTALAGWLLTESSPLAWVCLHQRAEWDFSMPGEPGNERNEDRVDA